MVVIAKIGIAIILLLLYLFITLTTASLFMLKYDSYEDAITLAYVLGIVIFMIVAMLAIRGI